MPETKMTPHERLQAFLFFVLRDHLPIGTLESVIAEHLDGPDERGAVVRVSDPALAIYTEHLAARILRTP